MQSYQSIESTELFTLPKILLCVLFIAVLTGSGYCHLVGVGCNFFCNMVAMYTYADTKSTKKTLTLNLLNFLTGI